MCNPSNSYSNSRLKPINFEIKAVYGKPFLFDLSKSIHYMSILSTTEDTPQPEDVKRSDDDIRKIMAELSQKEAREVTFDTIENRTKNFARVIIGWDYAKTDYYHVHLCLDVELTLSILSRTIGGMFFHAREPDYSSSTLFGQSVAMDVPVSESGIPYIEIVNIKPEPKKVTHERTGYRRTFWGHT